MLVAGGVIAYGHKKGEVREDKKGIQEAKALGKIMAKMLLGSSKSE